MLTAGFNDILQLGLLLVDAGSRIGVGGPVDDFGGFETASNRTSNITSPSLITDEAVNIATRTHWTGLLAR